MKYILLLIMMLSANILSENLPIIPQPQRVESKEGFFTLTKQITIYHDKKSFYPASLIAKQLKLAGTSEVKILPIAQFKINISLTQIVLHKFNNPTDEQKKLKGKLVALKGFVIPLMSEDEKIMIILSKFPNSSCFFLRSSRSRVCSTSQS